MASNYIHVNNAKKVCSTFHFDRHPSIVQLATNKVHSHKLFAPAVDLFYHVGLDQQFCELREPRQAQEDHKHGQKRARGKMQRQLAPAEVSYGHVLQRAMGHHLHKLLDADGAVCSHYFLELPSSIAHDASVLQLSVLDEVLSCVGTTIPLATDASMAADLAEIEADNGGGDIGGVPRSAHASSDCPLDGGPTCLTVFLQIVHTSASRQTRVRVAPAMPGRLESTSIIVSLHDQVPSSPGMHVVKASARPLGSGGKVLAVLSSLDLPPKAVREHARVWRRCDFAQYLQGSLVTQTHLDVVSRLVVENGDEGGKTDVIVDRVAAREDWLETLLALQSAGLAYCSQDLPHQTAWRLTETGLSAVTPCFLLHDSSLLFAVEKQPLDMNKYELMTHLEHSGWAWSLLPSRSRWAEQGVQPYRLDGPKVWYTTRSLDPPLQYLLCLAHADKLEAAGCGPCPHGARVRDYITLLENAGLISPRIHALAEACVEPDDPDVREPDAIMGDDPAAGEDGSDASSATSANAGNDSSSEGRAAEPVGGEVAMPLPIDDAGNDSGLEGPAPAAEPVGEVAIAMVLPPRDDDAPLARPREPSEHNHRWGHFIFALVRNKNRTWSWQCTCKIPRPQCMDRLQAQEGIAA